MDFDISEIKKLPVEERIKIIDAIWESCVRDDSSLSSDDEILNVVEERIEKYESGNMKTMNWDQFMKGLKNR
jgi:putative addiction module component (TIGR02574 family)